MILKKYEKLPNSIKNEEVKKYYNILKKKKFALIFKRVFDLFFSVFLIILLSPIMVITAIIIKIDSKGKVFYKQERVTKNSKIFKIIKFRTMNQEADKMGSSVTIKDDTRITKVGKILRKYRIDEIPQLFNIITGDMTFVGTRPEVKKYVDEYTDEMKATLLLPAGVTSNASIHFKDEDIILSREIDKNAEDKIDDIYLKKILPQKMKYNLEYLAKYNFWIDFKICIETIFGVLKQNDNKE